MACGNDHTAALSIEGHVYTWGKGEEGQLGYGEGFDHCTPRLVESLEEDDVVVEAISCGANFTMVLYHFLLYTLFKQMFDW